jgi:hypothetical protein
MEYENLLQELLFLKKKSACTWCSGTPNFFVVYQILAHK